MTIEVHLHTTLQLSTPQGNLRQIRLDLPDGAAVQDVLTALHVTLKREDMILVINHKVADVTSPLANGDRLDLIPAISGGSG